MIALEPGGGRNDVADRPGPLGVYRDGGGDASGGLGWPAQPAPAAILLRLSLSRARRGRYPCCCDGEGRDGRGAARDPRRGPEHARGLQCPAWAGERTLG